jgi:hypothetical protein
VSARLELGREQILAFRRQASHLDRRLPAGAGSMRQAAWAGLQDSMPRAALLSIHARVEGATPSSWEDPALVQTWGPRYSTYVIPREDIAVFTLGRLGGDPAAQRRAEEIAKELRIALRGRRAPDREIGAELGVNSNRFRYAATTGTVRIRWEGARAPEIWNVPAPDVDPIEAQLELARRYLHVFGPTTPASFAEWAGIASRRGPATFEALAGELIAVKTPIGEASLLARDEPAMRAAAQPAKPAEPPAPARLLPSGDTFFLLQGRDRELLVEEPKRRAQLWTSRVWPGAVLVGGEIAGTWRRANAKLDIEPWRRLTKAEREAVEMEAASLPLPGLEGRIRVAWLEP